MSGGRFEGHDPARGHDTAGVPWAGRTLTGTGFDDDEGAADAELAAALAAARTAGHSAGHAAERAAGPEHPAAPGGEERVVAAVAAARLLVPVVAVPGEVDDSTGLAADVSSDMAVVTLTAPDGARALPAFTSLDTLAAWDPEARPVPVEASRAAQAAVQEGCQVIVLDPPRPGTPPDQAAPAYVLRGSMVWALAMGRTWEPAHRDGAVAEAVAQAVRGLPAVRGHALAPGEDGALRVELELAEGLDQVTLQTLVTEIGQRIAADGEVRARIDALAFALRTAR